MYDMYTWLIRLQVHIWFKCQAERCSSCAVFQMQVQIQVHRLPGILQLDQVEDCACIKRWIQTQIANGNLGGTFRPLEMCLYLEMSELHGKTKPLALVDGTKLEDYGVKGGDSIVVWCLAKGFDALCRDVVRMKISKNFYTMEGDPKGPLLHMEVTAREPSLVKPLDIAMTDLLNRCKEHDISSEAITQEVSELRKQFGAARGAKGREAAADQSHGRKRSCEDSPIPAKSQEKRVQIPPKVKDDDVYPPDIRIKLIHGNGAIPLPPGPFENGYAPFPLVVRQWPKPLASASLVWTYDSWSRIERALKTMSQEADSWCCHSRPALIKSGPDLELHEGLKDICNNCLSVADLHLKGCGVAEVDGSRILGLMSRLGSEALSRIAIDALLLPLCSHTTHNLWADLEHACFKGGNQYDYAVFEKDRIACIIEAKKCCKNFATSELPASLHKLIVTYMAKEWYKLNAKAASSASEKQPLVLIGILSDGVHWICVQWSDSCIAVTPPLSLASSLLDSESLPRIVLELLRFIGQDLRAAISSTSEQQ